MPIHSMTGFGRGTQHHENYHVTVEISSVNRKQAEFALSCPRELSSLEGKIRPLLFQHISRGRIQVNLSAVLAQGHAQARLIEVDLPMASALEAAFTKLSATLGREIQPLAADFLRIPGIFHTQETTIDAESAWIAIEPALADALRHFIQSRAHEGEALQLDLQQRLALLLQIIEQINQVAPGRAARQSEALTKRLVELGCPIDRHDERLYKEIALFADRCDISEEITRLHCHLAKFQQYFQSNEAPGRAMDFLCQEIHRELNTIGSKAGDSVIAQAVVTGKTELEKIREQVQNIE